MSDKKGLHVINYSDNLNITSQCYVNNMPSNVYHSHNSISNSGLKLISRSPAHFKYPAKQENTRSKVLGSALHMACLEPDNFYKKYILLRSAKDRTTSEYKEAKKEHGEENVLVSGECEKVEGIMNALYSNVTIRKYLELPGYNELSGFSIDPVSSVMCRHRFDKLTLSGIGIDLKTTVDARKEAFSKSIFAYGYHIQNAFYRDQYKWITANDLNDFIFIVIESEPPYAAKLYRLDSESLMIGVDAYIKAIDTYCYCRVMDEWPGYDDQSVEEISIPKWAINKYDESLMEGFNYTE